MQRLLWDIMYLFRKTPWDTGITPPELRAIVERDQIHPGCALDLGCGTGTNVIYLAKHGFEAYGVDVSSRAIARAQRKIEQASLARRAHVYAGDVTRLDALRVNGPFDLALDMGCLHSLDTAGRARYAVGLASRMKANGVYLLYAFGPRMRWGGRIGIAPEEARGLFASWFELLDVAHGTGRGGHESAWYTFKRSGVKSKMPGD